MMVYRAAYVKPKTPVLSNLLTTENAENAENAEEDWG